MVDNDHSKCVKCYSSLNCSHFKWKEKKKKEEKSSISYRSRSMVADWGSTKARVLGIQFWARGCWICAEDFCCSLTPWTMCSVFFRWSSHMRSCVQSESSQCNLCQLVKVFLFTVASVTYKFSQWAGWHSSGAPSLACLFKKNRHAIDLLLVQFYSQSTIQCTRHSFSLSFLANTHIIV